MSQAKIDFVLEGFRTFEAGQIDIEGRWHENCRLTGPPGWPEQGPFEGQDAIRRQFERLGADYAETRFDNVEVVADQGEWLVVRFTWLTRGFASEIETAADMAAAFRVKNGRFLEGHYRWHPDEALKAAELSE